MILKTVNEITPEMLKKTDYILFYASLENDLWNFGQLFHKLSNKWYEITYVNHRMKETPIMESELMGKLKEKYNYFNKEHEYFSFELLDSKTFTIIRVMPRPHEVLISGTPLALMIPDVVDKYYSSHMKGYRTPRPSSKKHLPPVRVNVRKMF